MVHDRSAHHSIHRRRRRAHLYRCRGGRVREPRLRLAHAAADRIPPRGRTHRPALPPDAADHRHRRGRRVDAEHAARRPLPRPHREHQSPDHSAAAGRSRSHDADVADEGAAEHLEPQRAGFADPRLRHPARHDDLSVAHAGAADDGRYQRGLRDHDRNRPPGAQQPRVVDDAPAVARDRLRSGRRHRVGPRRGRGTPSAGPDPIREASHRGVRDRARGCGHAPRGRCDAPHRGSRRGHDHRGSAARTCGRRRRVR